MTIARKLNATDSVQCRLTLLTTSAWGPIHTLPLQHQMESFRDVGALLGCLAIMESTISVFISIYSLHTPFALPLHSPWLVRCCWLDDQTLVVGKIGSIFLYLISSYKCNCHLYFALGFSLDSYIIRCILYQKR